MRNAKNLYKREVYIVSECGRTPSTFFYSHVQYSLLSKAVLMLNDLYVTPSSTAHCQALGATIRYGSPNPINDALPALAQRACDTTPSVRSCLADVIGGWLLDLPDR